MPDRHVGAPPNNPKRHRDGPVHRVDVVRGPFDERYVTATVAHADAAAVIARALDDALMDDRAVAHVRLLSNHASTAPEVPIARWSEAEGSPRVHVDRYLTPTGEPHATIGIEIFVVTPRGDTKLATRAYDDGGWLWSVETGDARMGYLLRVASQIRGIRAGQKASYEAVFDRIEEAGFAPADLARTWCYFDDVLVEYDYFNAMRAEVFRRTGIAGAGLPASTGIQGVLDTGAHLTIDALAFSGSGVRHERVNNAFQLEADAYGSLFARARRVLGLGPEQLLVSGMASIGDDGATLHADDAARQVDITVACAEELLAGAGYSLADIVMGTAYVAPQHQEAVLARMVESPLAAVPFAVSIADVCRADLAFEIDFIAFK